MMMSARAAAEAGEEEAVVVATWPASAAFHQSLQHQSSHLACASDDEMLLALRPLVDTAPQLAPSALRLRLSLSSRPQPRPPRSRH